MYINSWRKTHLKVSFQQFKLKHEETFWNHVSKQKKAKLQGTSLRVPTAAPSRHTATFVMAAPPVGPHQNCSNSFYWTETTHRTQAKGGRGQYDTFLQFVVTKCDLFLQSRKKDLFTHLNLTAWPTFWCWSLQKERWRFSHVVTK